MIFPFSLGSLMIPDQCRGVCAFDHTSGWGQLQKSEASLGMSAAGGQADEIRAKADVADRCYN